MARKHKQKQQADNILEISKTGDVKTNDFDLIEDKIPPISTIKAQIRTAKNLITTAHTVPLRTEFDRLRIGINLFLYSERISFVDLGMEDVENPKAPPSYLEDRTTKQRRLSSIFNVLDDMNNNKDEDFNDFDISELFDDEFSSDSETVEQVITEDNEEVRTDEAHILADRTTKRRIRYGDYRETIGLINMFICDGFFVIDFTGKWMADTGILGSLHRDNIREALQKVLNLGVVDFDIDEFLDHSQVFVCDVCLDLMLDSNAQVQRFIEGISSFFPLASNRFNINKYGRHGLTLKPKAKTAGYSLIAYSKGQELTYSLTRSTKATRYVELISEEGEALARRTLRLEAKFYKLADIRSWLNVTKPTWGVVRLNEVLNSTAPVILRMFELFCGNAEKLLEHLEWMNSIYSNNNGLTLSEIFIAERFIDIFKQNNFDIELAKSHIKTEYINAGDTELEYFNRLANLRKNILNFLVYHKPRSITIMLAVLGQLHAYYSTGMGVDNV